MITGMGMPNSQRRMPRTPTLLPHLITRMNVDVPAWLRAVPAWRKTARRAAAAIRAPGGQKGFCVFFFRKRKSPPPYAAWENRARSFPMRATPASRRSRKAIVLSCVADALSQ